MRGIWRRIRESKGQSLVEFALVVPVLCLIFMGVFDFGWILHKQITMDNATRAAARRGAVGEDTDSMIQLVQDSIYFPVTEDQITVDVLDTNHASIGNDEDRTPDNYVVVEIDIYDVELMTPLRNLVPDMYSIHLKSRAEFLIE